MTVQNRMKLLGQGFELSQGTPIGALAGEYIGANSSVSLCVGAKALFGGPTRAIARQPLPVEGPVGVSLSPGDFRPLKDASGTRQSCCGKICGKSGLI
jgi:hypothetical protein